MSNNISATIVKTVQGVGYLSAFILSLVICVPMSMNQEQFKGRCLLFSTGLWQEKDGQFIVNWASQAYCNFTIFVAVIMFVVSVIQFGRFCKFLRRGRDSSFFSAFIDVLLCMLMCIFVLIAACFVTFGFQTWCNEMTRRFETCSDASGNPIDKADGIDSNGFFFQMSVAQFGIWSSFTIWVMLLSFSTVKLCRYHYEENLRVSMAKERKRLLNEDLVSEVPVNNSGFGASSNADHSQRQRRRRSYRGGGSSNAANIEEEGHFEEVVTTKNGQEDGNKPGGLVNDVVTEDFHQQQHEAPSPQNLQNQQQQQQQQPPQHNGDINVSLDDGSLSSMTSSQHSYNSLPKGNQIHIDQRPDLLK